MWRCVWYNIERFRRWRRLTWEREVQLPVRWTVVGHAVHVFFVVSRWDRQCRRTASIHWLQDTSRGQGSRGHDLKVTGLPRHRSQGETPAEARYHDEEAEADESDADNCRRRINTKRQSNNERNASNDCQTSSDTNEHQRSGLQTTRIPRTRTGYRLTWTRRTHSTVRWYWDLWRCRRLYPHPHQLLMLAIVIVACQTVIQQSATRRLSPSLKHHQPSFVIYR